VPFTHEAEAQRRALHPSTPTHVLFNQNRAAGGVQEFGPPREVEELAATVKLNAIEAVLCHGIDVALHVCGDIRVVVLGADAAGKLGRGVGGEGRNGNGTEANGSKIGQQRPGRRAWTFDDDLLVAVPTDVEALGLAVAARWQDDSVEACEKGALPRAEARKEK
jgi:hypothetical protein